MARVTTEAVRLPCACPCGDARCTKALFHVLIALDPGAEKWTEDLELETVRVVQRTAIWCAVPPEQIIGRSRGKFVIEAQRMATWVLYQRGMTKTEIGRELNRNHATIDYRIKCGNPFEDEIEEARFLAGIDK